MPHWKANRMLFALYRSSGDLPEITLIDTMGNSMGVSNDILDKLITAQEQYFETKDPQISLPLDQSSLRELITFLDQDTIEHPLKLFEAVHKVEVDADSFNKICRFARKYCEDKYRVTELKSELQHFTDDMVSSLLFTDKCLQATKAYIQMSDSDGYKGGVYNLTLNDGVIIRGVNGAGYDIDAIQTIPLEKCRSLSAHTNKGTNISPKEAQKGTFNVHIRRNKYIAEVWKKNEILTTFNYNICQELNFRSTPQLVYNIISASNCYEKYILQSVFESLPINFYQSKFDTSSVRTNILRKLHSLAYFWYKDRNWPWWYCHFVYYIGEVIHIQQRIDPNYNPLITIYCPDRIVTEGQVVSDRTDIDIWGNLRWSLPKENLEGVHPGNIFCILDNAKRLTVADMFRDWSDSIW